MSLFDVLNLIGGLSLFLFGMHVMGAALEKRAGGQLKALLGKLTGSKLAGFLTGLGCHAETGRLLPQRSWSWALSTRGL